MRECVDLFPAQRHGCHPRLGVTLERALVFSIAGDTAENFLDVTVNLQSLGGAVIEVQGDMLFGRTDRSDVHFYGLKHGRCLLAVDETKQCHALFVIEVDATEGYAGVSGDSLRGVTVPFPLTPVTSLTCPIQVCSACEAGGGVCVCGTDASPCLATSFNGPATGPCCTLPPA